MLYLIKIVTLNGFLSCTDFVPIVHLAGGSRHRGGGLGPQFGQGQPCISAMEALRDVRQAPVESSHRALSNMLPPTRWRPFGENSATEGARGMHFIFSRSPQFAERG